jgi:hypothetical protein
VEAHESLMRLFRTKVHIGAVWLSAACGGAVHFEATSGTTGLYTGPVHQCSIIVEKQPPIQCQEQCWCLVQAAVMNGALCRGRHSTGAPPVPTLQRVLGELPVRRCSSAGHSDSQQYRYIVPPGALPSMKSSVHRAHCTALNRPLKTQYLPWQASGTTSAPLFYENCNLQPSAADQKQRRGVSPANRTQSVRGLRGDLQSYQLASV